MTSGISFALHRSPSTVRKVVICKSLYGRTGEKKPLPRANVREVSMRSTEILSGKLGSEDRFSPSRLGQEVAREYTYQPAVAQSF